MPIVPIGIDAEEAEAEAEAGALVAAAEGLLLFDLVKLLFVGLLLVLLLALPREK